MAGVSRSVIAVLAVAGVGCGGGHASAPADGSADAAVDSPTATGDAPVEPLAPPDAGDAAISQVTAEYRACVAYFRAQCNRSTVCAGGTPDPDPCPTVTDSCPD